MHRTQIYFDEKEWSTLKLIALNAKSSISEMIRLAVRKTYLSKKHLNFDDALDNISGIWADKDIDTHQYIRTLRKGTRPKY